MRNIFCLSLIALLLSFTSLRQNALRFTKIKTNLAVTEICLTDMEADHDVKLIVSKTPAALILTNLEGPQFLIQHPVLEIIKKINPTLNFLYLAHSPPTLA